jgi:hypothetical protein
MTITQSRKGISASDEWSSPDGNPDESDGVTGDQITRNSDISSVDCQGSNRRDRSDAEMVPNLV